MNNGIYDEKESFLLYTSFYGLHFADLSNEEKGVLIDCIFQYTLTGRTNFEELEEDRGLKVSFRSIIDVIDRNNAKWAESKERRSNGNKKASVFPVPVGESSTILPFSRQCSTAACCIVLSPFIPSLPNALSCIFVISIFSIYNQLQS